MFKLKICRICLRSHCKMYKHDQFQLQLYYEQLMALHMDKKQNLPHYFCYECAALLHKFSMFKERCNTAQNTLIELQKWRSAISYDDVDNLRSQMKCIKSSIDIMTVSKRAKTYYFNEDPKSYTYISDTESIEDTESVKEQDTDIKSIEAEFVNVYEDSFEFHEEIETKHHSEPHIAEEPLNHDQESQKSDGLENVKELMNESVVKNSISSLENLLTHSNTKNIMVDSSKESQIKENINEKDYLHLKPNKKHCARQKKTKKGDKIKDTDFKPDNFSIYGLKEQNPANAKKKKRFLDPNHWKKSTLSEEEVIMNMKKKAEEPKYRAAEYKCTDCVKWFREEDILKRHRQLRHNENIGALECRFCHMRFKLDCHLRKHLRSHFNKYECLRCDLVCPLESTAMFHDDYHNGVIKKCKYCGEEFKHSSTYYTHLRTHRSEHLCTLCGMAFVSSFGLVMHKKAKHVASHVENDEKNKQTDTYCKKCEIRFETAKAYEEHVFQSALHTEGVELSRGKKPKPKRKKLKRPLEIKRKKPTTCHQCGQHFSTRKAYMKHHLAEHSGTSFFPPSERQICEICGLLLAPGRVTMHLNTHTREKRHSCETCGRQFSTAVTLKNHQVTHTGEKPYACPLCEKRFTQSNSMKLHYRTYHLKEPYPYRNKKRHSCETCGRQFSTSVTLKRHQVTHTGEKPYACPLCEKRFTQSNSMKLHYRTYHLKEPYPKRNRRKKEIHPEPLDHEESTSGDSFHE